MLLRQIILMVAIVLTGCSTNGLWTSSGSAGNSLAAIPGCGLTDIFNSSFVQSVAPNPNGLYGDVQTNFLAAASAFPSFANGSDCTKNKQELAAFWANATQESGLDPSGAQLQALYYISELKCMNVDGSIPTTNTIANCAYCQVNSPAPYLACTPSASASQQYFGRGPLQLSWNYNYQDFNTYIKKAACPLGASTFGLPEEFCTQDNYLVNNPSAVSQNGALALASALWYWNTQKGNAGITPHQAMQTGKGFGYTIKAINGGLECVDGGEGRVAALNRGVLYGRISQLLDVPTVTPIDCLNLPPLDGSANTFCGSSYDNAVCGPVSTCDGTDASCSNNEKCYQLPSKNICGSNWADAYGQYRSNNVTQYCPDGTNASCGTQTCFAMPTTNFCGSDWSDACTSSKNWGTTTCPSGVDGECPSGQKCFVLPLPGCSSGTCLP